MRPEILSKGMWLRLALSFFIALPCFSFASEWDRSQPIYAFEFLTFRGVDNLSFLEVFCNIPTDEIQFIKSEDGFLGRYALAIALYDALNNEIVSTRFTDSVQVKTFWEIDKPRTPHVIRFPFLVKPGLYKAQIRLQDLETRREAGFEKAIDIPDYQLARLQLSDVQLAHSIQLSDAVDVLVKNGRKVTPNVKRILGTGSDTLYAYTELYQLYYVEGEPKEDFESIVRIRDVAGEIVNEFSYRKRKPGESCVISLAVPITGLEAGQYQLEIVVTDAATGHTDITVTNFNLLKAQPKINI